MANHLSLARELARSAHRGQVDKAGDDYFEHHLTRVVEIIRERLHGGRVEVVVGYLHDIVEDTPITIETIRNLFGPDIARDVKALTRGNDEQYWLYIERVKLRGGRALIVKQADLLDHIDNAHQVPESLTKRYRKALAQIHE